MALHRNVLNSSSRSWARGPSTFSRYVDCSPIAACCTQVSKSRLPLRRECLPPRAASAGTAPQHHVTCHFSDT